MSCFVKILFITYHHLNSNSGIHIYNLANQLTLLGANCTVCVPNGKEKVRLIGEPFFTVINQDDLEGGQIEFDFDLIHVWTPREITRRITETVLKRCPCPYIVHLEDNEEFLLEAFTKIPVRLLKKVPSFLLDLMLPANLIHPLRYGEFLKNASGITLIVKELERFCPSNISKTILWAGYQEDLLWDIPTDIELKNSLGLDNIELIILYTGNVHAANIDEVSNLYRAIGIINDRGINTKLIRTGIDHVPFSGKYLNFVKRNYCIELGFLPRHRLPSLLSIADILVQPGKNGEFNNYRFPSKLPEFLASGKPVLLPLANIGHHLKNGEECVILEEGDEFDIAQKIEFLFLNEEIRDKIGSGGKRFAQKYLKWSLIAKKLFSFYHEF